MSGYKLSSDYEHGFNRTRNKSYLNEQHYLDDADDAIDANLRRFNGDNLEELEQQRKFLLKELANSSK
ncbi:hypothetical protein QR98_0013420 [Sarcoptes scabiei]|nr:hypothetical protein QR98_0013420 [Sarcoptes scabiei]